MQTTSITSPAKKIVLGLVFGAAIVLGLSSTACSVTVSNQCTGADVLCSDNTCALPDNVACSFDSDCCSNFCASDGFCGVGGGCFADGSGCTADSQCCTGVCSLGDDTCGCVADLSTGCAADSDCCLSSDICVNGVCQ